MTGQLNGEDSIIWLHDPAKFRYLREGLYLTTRPQQKPPSHHGKRLIVGYAVHRKRGSGTTAYHRRFWYLNKWDRDLSPDGPYSVHKFSMGPAPCEAVVPSSVRVGAASVPYGESELCAEDWAIRGAI